MMEEPTKLKPFNLQISAEDRALLEAHAKKRGVALSHIIRAAYKAYIEHEINNCATCANGTQCLAPEMWARSGAVTRQRTGTQ